MTSEEYQFLYQNGIIKSNKDRLFIPVEPNFELLGENTLNVDFFADRNRFSHKGDYGSAMLVGGSMGKGGACVLSARSCMRIGCGLLTVHVPQCLYDIMQISVPEAMVSSDSDKNVFSDAFDTDKYSALGIGPGLGTEEKTIKALNLLLADNKQNVVVDADAINGVAVMSDVSVLLNERTIITPHPKEFERLFGKFASYYDKIVFIKETALQYGVTIVLKGGITAVACNDGHVYFNTLGNPGMATAGSGDVLTGMILGLLSQGYSCKDSALLGVFLHALSGDIAKAKLSEHSLIASDIVGNIAFAVQKMSDLYRSK